MRTFVAFCLVLSLNLASVAGRTIYVDNVTGDDRFAGLQPRSDTLDQSGPVRTIAKALRLAGGGDTIVLAKTDQPYRESITLVGSHNSGSAQRPFAIRGNGAVLDGSSPVPLDAWEHYDGAVFRFRPPRMGCGQLFLDGRPAVRVFASRSAGRLPKLEARQWCLLDGEIYFRVDQTKLPSDYELSYAHSQTGVTLFHVDHVLIADLTVQAFRLDGINLYNSARNVAIVDVTCRGNGRSGIVVGGASAARIDGSLLGDNGQSQLLTLPCSETHVYRSDLLSNTAPGWADQGGHVYFDGKQGEGGLDEFQPAVEGENQP